MTWFRNPFQEKGRMQRFRSNNDASSNDRDDDTEVGPPLPPSMTNDTANNLLSLTDKTSSAKFTERTSRPSFASFSSDAEEEKKEEQGDVSIMEHHAGDDASVELSFASKDNDNNSSSSRKSSMDMVSATIDDILLTNPASEQQVLHDQRSITSFRNEEEVVVEDYIDNLQKENNNSLHQRRKNFNLRIIGFTKRNRGNNTTTSTNNVGNNKNKNVDANDDDDDLSSQGTTWFGKCSRNALILWALIATTLLIINLAVTSGMMSRANRTTVSSLNALNEKKCQGNNNNNIPAVTPAPATSPLPATTTTDSSSKDITTGGTTNDESNTNNDSTGDKKNVTKPTSSADIGGGTANKTTTSANRCGCPTCSDAVWSKPIGDPAYSCGQRVEYLLKSNPQQFPTEVHACRQIAFEYPCDCGSCDPSRCGLFKEEFFAPKGWFPVDDYTVPETPAPQSADDGTAYSMYCYPPVGQRVTYTNGWNNGYTIEVKDGQGNPAVCGPGDNRFAPDNVVYDTATAGLKLLYKNSAASEVRVILPNDEKYSYGTYRFEIGSITVSNVAGEVLSNILPKELVFGLFTWDDTESYEIHENYNHEVDIEISRWNCETNSDVQFLVQPPGFPQMHRFFSGGEDNVFDQENHVYEFTWKPAHIDWYSSAGKGQEFVLKTEEALYMDAPDYVQCMPDRGMQTEVRINLWNSQGAIMPTSMAVDDIVEVVITNFTFIPLTTELYVKDGGFCTKHCQCNYPTSSCDGGICTAVA